MSEKPSPLRDPVNQVRGVLILSAIGFFYPILAIPSFLFMIILSTSIPEDHPSRKRELLVLALSLTLCLAGIAKFIISDGMKGIVEAGYRATGKKALTSLREIRIAQDILRKKAYLDHDKDGIGESAHLSELMGLDKARGTIELPFAPLRNNFSRLETIGDAQIGYRSGYYLMVCLPTSETEWTAHPNTLPNDELAEANFRAYAWPAEPLNQRRLSTLSTPSKRYRPSRTKTFRLSVWRNALTARAETMQSSRGQPGETRSRGRNQRVTIPPQLVAISPLRAHSLAGLLKVEPRSSHCANRV